MMLRIELTPEFKPPTDGDYREGRTWPTEPRVWVSEEHRGVRFEAGYAAAGSRPVLVELTIRPVRRLERAPLDGGPEAWLAFQMRVREAEKRGELLYAEPLRGLTTRTIRRLPFDTFLRRAAVVAGTWFEARRIAEERGEGVPFPPDPDRFFEELRKARAPKGRPRRGRSVEFYRDIATLYRALRARGIPASVEIARRKGVSPELARQWIFRARKLGFLPPAKEG